MLCILKSVNGLGIVLPIRRVEETSTRFPATRRLVDRSTYDCQPYWLLSIALACWSLVG